MVLSPQRILEVKEMFLNALQNAAVPAEKMAEIRNRLGLPAELDAGAEKLCEMLRKHLDVPRNIRDRFIMERIDETIGAFRREIFAAGDNADQKAQAIQKFANNYYHKCVKGALANLLEAETYLLNTPIKPPKTFASALVTLLLDNFDATEDAFTEADGFKIGIDAKAISIKELGASILASKETIKNKMKEDATRTAVDTDTSSYRIDIDV